MVIYSRLPWPKAISLYDGARSLSQHTAVEVNASLLRSLGFAAGDISSTLLFRASETEGLT